MRIGILGTGNVGQGLGAALVSAGHTVMLGSRSADKPEALAWAAATGEGAGVGTFATAARGADLLINATGGMVSLAALATCDAADLAGKTMIDAANPLDMSGGWPPTLGVCNDSSIAEQIQSEHPDLRVVKALNTVAVEVMVNPGAIPGDHLLPIAGDHDDAKAEVRGLLHDLGWRDAQIRDLGGLDGARGMEMWLPLWIRLYSQNGHPMFNLMIATAPDSTAPR